MQDVTVSIDSSHPVADIRMLPIISLNPNDMTCIFSTLTFLEKQATRLNMETACVTFDQPLYIKAVEVSFSSDLRVVCRLGGFHLLMNFLGAIGDIMAGSGLSDALETCYGLVKITHMMTGKAYSKAIRGHFLSESALMVSLLEKLFDSTVDVVDVATIEHTDINELKQLYLNISDHTLQFTDDQCQMDCMRKLHEAVTAYKLELVKSDRTATLWMQYLSYIGIVKQFLRAERTSNWKLHLHSIAQMLNLFAAAGHKNYCKCARLYLQLMTELPTTHPWLHEQLSSDRHAVRRSDRHWAGISPDLAIEQLLMRPVHSRGGLTHGR